MENLPEFDMHKLIYQKKREREREIRSKNGWMKHEKKFTLFHAYDSTCDQSWLQDHLIPFVR